MDFYYHITEKDWPDRIKLNPRIVGRNRSPWESRLPRICVCPTPWHCLISIPRPISKLFVFRTLRQCKVERPDGILDAHVTLEGWRTKPTSFVKVNEIDLEVIEQMDLLKVVGTVWAIERQRQALERAKSIYITRYGERHEHTSFIRSA